jgi:hypothetical protein
MMSRGILFRISGKPLLQINLILCILIVVIVTLSCRDVNKGIPDNAVSTIHPDTLINILYDIHLIDAIILSKIVKFEEQRIDSLMYESLFNKYSVTREELENSLLYYTHYRLDSLDLLYSTVLDRFHTEKGEITR